MTIEEGYILTSYLQQSSQGIEIHYLGKANFGPFKLIIPQQKHVFFIPSTAKFSPNDFEFVRSNSALKSFNQDSVVAIYLSQLKDIARARQYCEREGIRTYEIDVQLSERFLMERFIFSTIEFTGEFQEARGMRIYTDPQVRPGKKTTELSILSLDIETGINDELYSIAFSFRDGAKVVNKIFMLADKFSQMSDELVFLPSENEVLTEFLKAFELMDPDLICGWHVIGFDLMFLEKKAKKFGLKLNLGREQDEIKLEFRQGAGYLASLKGRVVLDGPPILRGAFYQFQNFKLDTVAFAVLGVGKDIASDANKVLEIERRFKEDKVALAKYNLLDCTLVLDIFEKLNIVDLLIQRTINTGLHLERINISTAAFDFIFLPRLHRKGYVASNRAEVEREQGGTGGLVMEPVAGLHRNVTIFDFKSLYPSIIRTFNICPYSLMKNNLHPVRTPCGVQFSGTETILPDILSTLFDKRAAAKVRNDQPLSQAIKILMNSFYGIMGSTRSRFYHADLPEAITTTGHYLLKAAREFFENRGLVVLYGDTDSLFVTGSDAPEELAMDLDSFIARLLKSEFNVESKLECEFEKTFDQLYFPYMRGGQGGAKKRYAGIIRGELEFKGMEAVRSDWTLLAKNFQTGLFAKFFAGEDIESYIKLTIEKLEQGEFDQDLVYTKRLSKPAHEYVKNVPVHVKAALKVDHKGPYPLREISYVVTRQGPEPMQNAPKDFDYHHYIEKQIKPLADDVLISLGKNFESLRLGDQLSLF